MSAKRLFDNFIPYDCYETIYNIDYNKLYSIGFKIILFDLDNTISRYKESVGSIEAIKLITDIKKIGFKVFVLSNNSEKRIKKSVNSLDVIGFSKARKPLKGGYKKVLKYLKENNYITCESEVVSIGDQILTDVLGSNRMNIKAILVKPIHLPSEKWYTKVNRRTERMIINMMKKRNYEIYKKIKLSRGESFE